MAVTQIQKAQKEFVSSLPNSRAKKLVEKIKKQAKDLQNTKKSKVSIRDFVVPSSPKTKKENISQNIDAILYGAKWVD